jgi:hypothetical protein
VIEAGQDLGLGEEALANVRLRRILRSQPFDGDWPLQLNVRSPVDDRHAPLAEGFADQVAVARCRAGPFVGLDVVGTTLSA